MVNGCNDPRLQSSRSLDAHKVVARQRYPDASASMQNMWAQTEVKEHTDRAACCAKVMPI